MLQHECTKTLTKTLLKTERSDQDELVPNWISELLSLIYYLYLPTKGQYNSSGGWSACNFPLCRHCCVPSCPKASTMSDNCLPRFSQDCTLNLWNGSPYLNVSKKLIVRGLYLGRARLVSCVYCNCCWCCSVMGLLSLHLVTTVQFVYYKQCCSQVCRPPTKKWFMTLQQIFL